MAARGQSQVQEFLDILKRRVWQAFLPVLVALAVGNAIATMLPRQYEVRTQLELRETSMPTAGEGMVAKGIQRDVASAQYHIKSSERVRRVIEKLEWQDFTSLTPILQFEYLKRTIKNTKVQIITSRGGQGSSFITIVYSDSDPQRAEQFCNRLRDAYTTEVVERFRNDARNVRDNYQNQLAIAQQLYRDKEKAAAELKRKHGLSATQQAPGPDRQRTENPVFTRLTAGRGQLADIEISLSSDTIALETLRMQYAEAPREVPEETLTGGLHYEAELTRIEGQIQAERDRQIGLRPAHSIYQAAEEKIGELDAQKDALLSKATDPSSEVRLVLNPRREVLAGQVQDKELAIKQHEAQRIQLQKNIDDLATQHAELAEIYREIRELDGEVFIARKNFTEAATKYERNRSFVEQINQPHANPFIVSDEALAPRKHTSPNEAAILAAALFIGLALGLGMAVVAEFGHNGFRGVGDITRSMAIPVLGVVNAIVTRDEARRRVVRSVVVTSSTLILVGAIVWVTWAYENSPRLLGSELTRFIDDLRSQFR
jgi:uncharacterized protein involved in exopolysaccharide biosynthesis